MQMDLQSYFLCGHKTQAFHWTSESPSAYLIGGYESASSPSESTTPLWMFDQMSSHQWAKVQGTGVHLSLSLIGSVNKHSLGFYPITSSQQTNRKCEPRNFFVCVLMPQNFRGEYLHLFSNPNCWLSENSNKLSTTFFWHVVFFSFFLANVSHFMKLKAAKRKK